MPIIQKSVWASFTSMKLYKTLTFNSIDFNILTNAKQKIKTTYELKPEQITALRAFMEQKDIVCFLPTGFGKSIIL